MKNHAYNFTDFISGKCVYDAECSCGRKWMVDTLFPITIFKVEKKKKK